MSARATFHHLDAIGFGVGNLFGSLVLDMIAARQQDIVLRRMAARRARINAKLDLLRKLRARRMAQTA